MCPALRNETAAARPPSPAPTIATFKGREVEPTPGEDIIGEFLAVERRVFILLANRVVWSFQHSHLFPFIQKFDRIS
jgi:hypothetical protein